MITRTRITVDAATQDVLDKLTQEMEREPRWVEELRKGNAGLCREIQESTSAARQAETDRAQAEKATQQHRAEQVCRLESLTQSVQSAEQQLVQRQDTAGSLLNQLISGQSQAEAAMNQACRDLQTIQQFVAPMTEQLQALSAQTQQQATQLAAIQPHLLHQQNREQELLQALQASQAALAELRTDQMRLNEALQRLTLEVSTLNQPWWSRVFKRQGQ